MDISRPDLKLRRRRRTILLATVSAVVVAFALFFVLRLKPAVPAVERSSILDGHGKEEAVCAAGARAVIYTTKPAGTGIGLALAQQIWIVHKGAVSLANRKDARGCTAEVRLPLSPASA